MKNRAGEAGALSSLGNAYLNLARYEKGIEYCGERSQSTVN